jgi:hypothetical protein
MAEAKGQIGFDELGLAGVLKQYRLRVPPNQREYAWEQEQVNQLMRDLAKAIEDGETYFLGTIVTIPRQDGTLEVVDGQQRLATTAILLTAISAYLAENDEGEIATAIDTELLTGSDKSRRGRVPKLSLNIDDNELFKQIITHADPLPEPTRESHRLLLDARQKTMEQARRVVAPLDKRDHGDTLNRWVNFLEEDARVILLRVPDDANAYKMFETLNDRGLRTSQADLVKNYLFGRAGDRFSEVQTKWSYMRGALETSDEDDITIHFLRHALIVQLGHTRQVDVFDFFQDLVRSEGQAVSFTTTLDTLANAYVATLNPADEEWNAYPESVRRSIEVLALLRIRPLRPLVLAVAARMNHAETRRSLEFLVSLGVRLQIASNTRSGAVELPLAEAAKAVFSESITAADELKAELADVTPSDARLNAAFEFARVSNARQARYYLRSLQMAADAEEEPWFIPQTDRDVINLEHVLPRDPEGNWPHFTDDEVRQNSTRLGNLALMRASDNSVLKSAGFEEKKVVLADSPYSLTAQIGQQAEWTPATIQERQKELAELAVRAWPI